MVTEHFLLEFGKALSVAKAQVLCLLAEAHLLNVIEFGGRVFVVISIITFHFNTRHLAIIQKINQQIKQRDHVIASACRVKLELIYTGKCYVAVEFG